MIYFLTPFEGTFPGISRLFEETINIVGGEHIYLNDLHKVREKDTIIFGAWEPSAYPLAIRRCKAKNKIVHWASPPLQAELASVEIDYLNTILNLLDKNVIQGLWVIEKNNYEILKREGVFYTPVPFSLERLKRYRKKGRDKEGVCFFTVFHNKQKNVLTQLGGVLLAQKETDFFTFFVNGLTEQQKKFVDMIGLQYTDLHFLPLVEYFECISSARLLLQVSVSEAFSYIAAESLALGTPVLSSPIVARNMGLEEQKLIVNDISNANEISSLISQILEMGDKEYDTLCRDSIKAIEKTAEENNKAARDFAFLEL
ncbi:MAG: glycosyltransferase [Candidatus Omnitrophica bacterium]|nr:glycosyltransferase [Candidatus Omnitrophota bacterium]